MHIKLYNSNSHADEDHERRPMDPDIRATIPEAVFHDVWDSDRDLPNSGEDVSLTARQPLRKLDIPLMWLNVEI